MKPNDEIGMVAVVGAGLIGSGWAAYFLAQGLDVVATDPAPNAKQDMQQRVDRVWPLLEQLGLQPGASRGRLRFHPDLEEAVESADFVQENGPERDEVKRKLFQRLDAVLPPNVILASSSSGLKMSSIQSGG